MIIQVRTSRDLLDTLRIGLSPAWSVSKSALALLVLYLLHFCDHQHLSPIILHDDQETGPLTLSDIRSIPSIIDATAGRLDPLEEPLDDPLEDSSKIESLSFLEKEFPKLRSL